MTQDRNSTGETKCGGGGEGDGRGRMEQKRNMANGKVRRGDEELIVGKKFKRETPDF